MASLQRKVITLTLPSFLPEKISVKVYDKIIAEDMDALDFSGKSDPKLSTYKCYARAIIEWGFKDEKGEPLPITPENVKLLPVDDLNAIMNNTHISEQLTRLADLSEAKKNS